MKADKETSMRYMTDEEIKIIHKHREEKAAVAQRLWEKLKILELAMKFEKWLQDNGRGPSFSTFVNEFGYEEKDASSIFKAVMVIRLTANDLCR